MKKIVVFLVALGAASLAGGCASQSPGELRATTAGYLHIADSPERIVISDIRSSYDRRYASREIDWHARVDDKLYRCGKIIMRGSVFVACRPADKPPPF